MKGWHEVALGVFLSLSLAVAAAAAPPLPQQGDGLPQQGSALPQQGNRRAVGSMTGQIVTAAGEPLAGGTVQFFNDASGPPPSRNSYWRVPDFTRRLDQDGKFTVQLPPGTFYLGAIKRTAGTAVGPPQQGDLFLISGDELGVPKAYRVLAGVPLDVGRLGNAVPFDSSTVTYGKGTTAIEGVVLDPDGNPVAKAHVMAFTSANAVGRPLFTAEPTGKDGKFILRVADGGSYYVKARTSNGGAPPAAGELVSSFGDRPPIAVTLKKGEHQGGITINVVIFPGRGREPAAREQSGQGMSSSTRR